MKINFIIYTFHNPSEANTNRYLAFGFKLLSGITVISGSTATKGTKFELLVNALVTASSPYTLFIPRISKMKPPYKLLII